MKDFDIEKIKRENIFIAKEDLFQSMQAKVLAEVIPKKRARIINLNWAYTAAAAIAMIFGFTFINTTSDANQEAAIALESNSEASQKGISFTETVKDTEKLVFTEKIPEAYLTSDEPIYPKETSAKAPIKVEQKVNIASNKKEKTTNPELQVDQILASFTSSDLSNVGKNTEQDIYLDLYY